MSETKIVVYEWTDDDGQEYRVVDSPLGPVPQALYEEADDVWLGVGDERVGAEILRLSANLEETRRRRQSEGEEFRKALAEAEERKTNDRYWEGHRDGVADERGRAKGNDVVFSCPNCGTPSAETAEPHLDIHAGATYTCGNCRGAVVFEALTVDEYIERQPDPDKSAHARAEGRVEGMWRLWAAIEDAYESEGHERQIQKWKPGKLATNTAKRMIAAAERELSGKEDGDE